MLYIFAIVWCERDHEYTVSFNMFNLSDLNLCCVVLNSVLVHYYRSLSSAFKGTISLELHVTKNAVSVQFGS